MTSHDVPIEDIRKLLEEDRARQRINKYYHICDFSNTYFTSKKTETDMNGDAAKGWRYCKCGKWEDK